MLAESEVRWVPVGELGEVRMGKQLSPASSRAEGQMPYLRVANVFEGRIDYSDVKEMGFTDAEKRVYGLRDGDILLNEGQESLFNVGRSAIYRGNSGNFCFQNTLIRFRAGEMVLPEYAQEVFAQWRRRGVFASVAEKTSISHLGGSRFSKIDFPLIPLPQQRRIIEIVDSVADSECSIESTIVKIRAVRDGILLSGMSPILAAEPPPGWERISLSEAVPSVDYGISLPLDNDSRGIPTLRMNNLRGGRPYLADLRYCPQVVHPRYFLRVGDVLFNRTNSMEHVGRAGIWGGELKEATFASYLVRLNLDSRRVIPRYLVEWLQHPIIRQRVRSVATVAVQQVNVNPSRLRELEIDLPVDLAEQCRLVAALEACDERIRAELAELEKLRAVKQGVISELLSADKVSRAA